MFQLHYEILKMIKKKSRTFIIVIEISCDLLVSHKTIIPTNKIGDENGKKEKTILIF